MHNVEFWHSHNTTIHSAFVDISVVDALVDTSSLFMASGISGGSENEAMSTASNSLPTTTNPLHIVPVASVDSIMGFSRPAGPEPLLNVNMTVLRQLASVRRQSCILNDSLKPA